MAIFSHFDVGGGTGRRGNFNLRHRGTVSMIGKPLVQELKFRSGRELIEHACEGAKEISENQNTIIYSIAGPVDNLHRTIVKITNQDGIEQKNIPFAEEVENRLSAAGVKNKIVYVINDGESAAYAEFSPLGILAKLNDGDLGMAVIIGNGVGGRLYMKKGDRIVPVPGAFEPGHRLVPRQLVRQLGIVDLFHKPKNDVIRFNCGCGIKSEVRINGDSLDGNDICYETLVKGPAFEKLFNRFLTAISINNNDSRPLRERLRSPRPTMTFDEVNTSPFFWSVTYGHYVNNKELSRILSEVKGKEPISDTIFAKEGTILGYVFQKIQDGFNDYANPITFALVAGVGGNFGKFIVPHVESYLGNMKRFNQISSWGKTPNVTVGKLPSDETNLYGDMFYMLDINKHKA
jgi:hypothetical protein